MKVLLVNPAYTSYGPRKASLPLGLAYVAAAALRAGHSVRVMDLETMGTTEDLLAELQKHPQVVGVSANTALTFPSAIKVSGWAKTSGAVVVLGGVHASACAEAILNDFDCVDYIAVGEADESFPALLGDLAEGRQPRTIRGVVGRTGNSDQTRAFVGNLDALPWPARTLFLNQDEGLPGSLLTVSTSRGCPRRCGFCSAGSAGVPWRCRSVKDVAAEIVDAASHLEIGSISLLDDNALVNPSRLLQLISMVEERGLTVPWSVAGSAEMVLAAGRLLPELRRHGLHTVELGIESGSDRILRSLGKGLAVRDNELAVSALREAGIGVTPDLIMFTPDSTVEDIGATLTFIRRMEIDSAMPDDYLFNCLALYPGTRLRQDYQTRFGTTAKPYEIAPYNFSDPAVDWLHAKWERVRLTIRPMVYSALARTTPDTKQGQGAFALKGYTLSVLEEVLALARSPGREQAFEEVLSRARSRLSPFLPFATGLKGTMRLRVNRGVSMTRTESGAIVRYLDRTWRVNRACALTLDFLAQWRTVDELLSVLASNYTTSAEALAARTYTLLGNLLESGVVQSLDWEATAVSHQ